MRPAMDRTLAMDGLRSVVVIACTAALQSAGTGRRRVAFDHVIGIQLVALQRRSQTGG